MSNTDGYVKNHSLLDDVVDGDSVAGDMLQHYEADIEEERAFRAEEYWDDC